MVRIRRRLSAIVHSVSLDGEPSARMGMKLRALWRPERRNKWLLRALDDWCSSCRYTRWTWIHTSSTPVLRSDVGPLGFGGFSSLRLEFCVVVLLSTSIDILSAATYYRIHVTTGMRLEAGSSTAAKSRRNIILASELIHIHRLLNQTESTWA